MNIYHRLIQKYLELHRKSKTLRRFRMGLAVIVVFATVYQLILPSLTMTKKAANEKAGIDIGSEKVKVLDCGLKVHHHDKSCYKKIDGKKVLVCGQADYVIHEHDDSCYAVDENGEKTLVCKLPEIKAHKHDKDCYEEELVLVCDKEEREGHEHTDECYEEETKLVCDKDEHTHDEDCYEEVEDEDGNITRELVCDKKEHEHDDDCYKTTRKLICDKKEEEGHTHSDKCYETKKVLTCGEAELHEHTKKCYEKGHNGDPEYLICEKLELKEHSHGEKCFDIIKNEKKLEDKEKDEEKKEDKEKEEVEAEKEETNEEETIVVETEAEEQDSSEEYVETETDTASIESTDETSEETEIEDTEQEEEEEEEKDTEDKEDANEDDDETESSVKEIKFSRRLSDTTGIWRRYDDGSWTRVKASTILTRNENLMVRIAYVIPKGTLSEDNAYVVYKLPDNLGTTQVTADRINDEENHLNQIMEGSRLPNDEKSGDENLAGKYEMVYAGEDENGVDRFSLALQFNDYTIEENASADVEGWLMFYLREIALPTDEDGNGKIVFSKKAADGKELAVSYKVDAEETQDAEEQDEQAETEEPQTEETNEIDEETKTPVDITHGITYPALNLEASSETVTVSVQAEEGALPLGTTMIVEDVQDEGILNSIRDAASGEEASVEVKYVQAVDITFFDKTGREIEPLKPVRVSITCPEDNKSEDALVMHVDKEGSVQTVDQVDKEEMDKTDTANENAVTFDADSFSVYAVVGTETMTTQYITGNGETYSITLTYTPEANIPKNAVLLVSEISEESDQYQNLYEKASEAVLDGQKASMPFARFFDISIMSGTEKIQPAVPVNVKIDFKEAVEAHSGAEFNAVHFDEEGTDVIDVTTEKETVEDKDSIGSVAFEAEGFSIYGVTYTVDFHWEVDGEEYEFSLEGGAGISLRELFTALGICTDDPETEEDEVRTFLDSIVDVQFSDPELGWVGKVNHDNTILDIKEFNEFECEYSRFLSEEEKEKLDSRMVYAGEWGFVSMRPFTSEESLTVTMEDGEEFVVKVTDAQISTNVLTADGKTYKITVTYDDDTEIPEGTTLEAKEIEPGTDEYLQKLGQVWAEINKEYLEVEEMREHYSEGMGVLPDVSMVNLDNIRFFDLKLSCGGEEVELDIPLEIEISFDNGMKQNGETVLGIVNYTEEEVKIVDAVNPVTEDDTVVAFRYEQKGISDTAVYVGQKIYDEKAEPEILPAPAPMEYPMLQKGAAKAGALRAAGDDANEDDDETDDEDEGNEVEPLTKPVATKTLSPNENDGTYTLELAINGKANSSTLTEVHKSNVLIIMDRSSSMVNNYPTGSINTTAVATRNAQNGRYYSGQSEFVPTPGVKYFGQVYSNGSNRYRELNYTITTEPNGTQHYNWTYYNTDTQSGAATNYTGDNIYTGTYVTRLSEEQAALSVLLQDLLAHNGEGTTTDGVRLDDIIEISVISFARQRGDKENGASTEVDWTTNYTDLMSGVNNNFAPPGTNWEDALRYAMDKANNKMADPSQAGEDLYIIFLTDGEPTAVTGESNGANHYDNTGGGYIVAYNAARDYVVSENGIAAGIANNNYKFYGIFTWGLNATMKSYLKRLVNAAYGHTGASETDYTTEEVDEDGVDDRYYDADSITALEEAFSNIFNHITDSIGYEQVTITDGLTTDAMTTTLVDGSTKGFKYTVYKNRVVDANGNITNKGTPVYTVTASDSEDDPTVTFTIDGHDYTGIKDSYTYDELQADGTTEQKTKDYYYVTVGEGDNAEKYMMTLAEKNGGSLTWDLSALGTLVDGYTYAVSFLVWPDQDAYDYVAALNNGLSTIIDSHGETVTVAWNQSIAEKVTDSEGNDYYRGGCSKYPSVVYYPSPDDTVEDYSKGIYKGTFAVLTNTDQDVKYSIVETKNVNGVITKIPSGPFTFDLPTPNPMKLANTKIPLEKIWEAGLDIEQYLELLWRDYKAENPEDPTKYGVNLVVWAADTAEELAAVETITEKVAANYDLNADSSISDVRDAFEMAQTATGHDYYAPKYYEAVPLGWNEDKQDYVWEDEISIAPGIMINLDSAVAKGLVTVDSDGNIDSNPYNYSTATYGNITYVILESGHYYTVTEPTIDRHFELNTHIYHPMLVDSSTAVSNVTFKVVDGEVVVDSIVTPLESVEAENTLKGGINILKRAFDGETEIVATDDIFTVEVTLKNPDGSAYTDFDYRIYYGENNPKYEDTETYQKHRTGHIFGTEDAKPSDNTTEYTDDHEPGENQHTILGNDNGIIILDLYIGDTARIINVPAGVTYSVVETKVNGVALDGNQAASNYVYDEIVYEISEGSSENYVIEETDIHAVHGNSSSQATVYNKVPTQKIGIKKIGQGVTTNTLEGVTFKLYKDKQCTNQITKDALGKGLGEKITTTVYYTDDTYETVSEEETEYSKEVIYYTDDTHQTVSEEETAYYEVVPSGIYDGIIKTDSNGLYDIGTLKAGKYYLKEIGVGNNAGYITLSDPIEITVNNDSSIDYTKRVSYYQSDYSPSTSPSSSIPGDPYDYATGNGLLIQGKIDEHELHYYYYTLTINNNTGTTLPNTGGPGTKVFMIFGIILILLASMALMITRRRTFQSR